MGATPFPSTLYPCILADGFEAVPEHDVTVQSAGDLSEQRLYNGRKWVASFRLLTPTAALRTTLLGFWDARYGALDSFPFTSPDDAVTRQVRFESMRGRHVDGPIWEYQIALSEVV
jgi:hypothetical protein